ncbi:MAG: hypothetical protein WAT70_08545, partial [Rhizobiaceae bacterium]
MAPKRMFAAAALLLAMATGAGAETLVLVQGYLGTGWSWRVSGVAPVLVSQGFADAGHLTLG